MFIPSLLPIRSLFVIKSFYVSLSVFNQYFYCPFAYITYSYTSIWWTSRYRTNIITDYYSQFKTTFVSILWITRVTDKIVFFEAGMFHFMNICSFDVRSCRTRNTSFVIEITQNILMRKKSIVNLSIGYGPLETRKLSRNKQKQIFVVSTSSNFEKKVRIFQAKWYIYYRLQFSCQMWNSFFVFLAAFKLAYEIFVSLDEVVKLLEILWSVSRSFSRRSTSLVA